MKRAFVGIREQPVYRRDAFVAGLRACGYDTKIGTPPEVDADTVYVSWNRYSVGHDVCGRVERAGGIALIAENAYVGLGGSSPHSSPTREWYSLARGSHNDDRAVTFDESRDLWKPLGIELQPWRESGGHVLIAPNRSFGEPGRIMPADWAEATARKLRALTKREIRIRAHPGNNAPTKPLAEDLAGAHCTIIWHSSAGVHSLIQGVPVISCAPAWIAMSAAGSDLSQIEAPPMPDRLPAMQRLAQGQFNLCEIANGSAFEHVLGGVRTAG